MATQTELPAEERILQVLRHLGVEKAHFAARVAHDWQGLAASHPECIASLTLVCPVGGTDPGALRPLAPRLLVLNGDEGVTAERVRGSVTGLPDAVLTTLPGYSSSPAAADVIADRLEDIGSTMTDFLSRVRQHQEVRAISLAQSRGEEAGISYRVEGSGPPLVLLPLAFAPSQWEPLLPRLSQRYCTIVLGGAYLGNVARLEDRGRSPGYLRVVRSLIDEAQLRPGETVLDVGCGTGVLDRWLVRHTGGRNRVTGVDINLYLIREGVALASREGLEEAIELREGSAEDLPFPNSSFDVTMAVLVLGFVDADRMLTEMLRVTRPGGRVAVIERAEDRPLLVNLPLRTELKAKVEAAPRAGVAAGGCADASLYRLFRQARLDQVKMFPNMAVESPYGLQGRLIQSYILPTLSPDEANEWRAAVAQAQGEGTFFIAELFHCAVGTKPG